MEPFYISAIIIILLMVASIGDIITKGAQAVGTILALILQVLFQAH